MASGIVLAGDAEEIKSNILVVEAAGGVPLTMMFWLPPPRHYR